MQKLAFDITVDLISSNLSKCSLSVVILRSVAASLAVRLKFVGICFKSLECRRRF